MKEYHVEQVWAGWFGGLGSSGSLQNRLNELSAQGWTLARTEVVLRFWMWFVLRPRLMVICERTATSPPAS